MVNRLIKADDKSTATGYYVKYIKIRIQSNKNFLCAITGSTGSGKSYSALSLMEQINPDKTAEQLIKNVAFNAQEFMERINRGNLQSGDVLIWDEAGVGLSSKSWQSLANKVINFLLQTFRNMNLIVIFTLPHFSFLDAGSRKLMHGLLQTQKVNRNEKYSILKPFILQVNQETGQIYRKYLRIKSLSGANTKVTRIKCSLASKDLVKLYEEKKIAFTRKLNDEIEKKLNVAHKKETKEIDNLTQKQREVVELYDQGLTQEEIGEMIGLSEKSVRMHIQSAKIKGYVRKKIENAIENAVFTAKSVPLPIPQLNLLVTP